MVVRGTEGAQPWKVVAEGKYEPYGIALDGSCVYFTSGGLLEEGAGKVVRVHK